MGATFERIVASPPLVIAFRGHQLDKVMRQHRISKTDLNSALRKYGIWNIKEVECVIIGESRWWSVPYGSGKSCRRDVDLIWTVGRVYRIILRLQEVRFPGRHGRFSASRAPLYPKNPIPTCFPLAPALPLTGTRSPPGHQRLSKTTRKPSSERQGQT
jgi:hypothetical protein